MIDEKKLIEELENLKEKTIIMPSDIVFNNAMKIAIDTVNDQPKLDKWISVDDALPEDGKTVLCWYEYFRFGNYNRMYQDYGIGWQCRGWWGGISGVNVKVLAWMTLPEPYGGNENE